MSEHPLTVHIMTAALVPGDAIGNYVLTLRRLWQNWGAHVRLYADHIAPSLRPLAAPADQYRPTGHDLLWYHYSIATPNLGRARASSDFKLMDYHGISPPELYRGRNAQMEALCREGLAQLPELRTAFDQFIVHTEYMRADLLTHGFPAERLAVVPLCVDTARYPAADDAELAELLPHIEYLLFVGRLIPQKDILAQLAIFAELQTLRPELYFFLVGPTDLTPGYEAEMSRFIKQQGLTEKVIRPGKVTNPALLGSLFRHARFLLVTSEWESFCVPLAEAAFMGTPSAIDDLPPLPEVAGPGALVIDKKQPATAARLIHEALLDEGGYAERRQQSQHWAMRYSDDALAANIRRLLPGWLGRDE